LSAPSTPIKSNFARKLAPPAPPRRRTAVAPHRRKRAVNPARVPGIQVNPESVRNGTPFSRQRGSSIARTLKHRGHPSRAWISDLLRAPCARNPPTWPWHGMNQLPAMKCGRRTRRVPKSVLPKPQRARNPARKSLRARSWVHSTDDTPRRAFPGRGAAFPSPCRRRPASFHSGCNLPAGLQSPLSGRAKAGQ